jgi:hypothetical protein
MRIWHTPLLEDDLLIDGVRNYQGTRNITEKGSRPMRAKMMIGFQLQAKKAHHHRIWAAGGGKKTEFPPTATPTVVFRSGRNV